MHIVLPYITLFLLLFLSSTLSHNEECAEGDSLPDPCNNHTDCSSAFVCTLCINAICSPIPACARPCNDSTFCEENGGDCTVCLSCEEDPSLCRLSADTTHLGICVHPEEEGQQLYMQIIGYVAILVLLILSGLFSGLNLALMGLDLFSLEIILKSGSKRDRAYAKRIYPLRKRGNLLLCTILLGNVAVNSLMSILMADITTGILGFILSTAFIVIFGEITPQSMFSRHALAVGAKTTPIVWFFMIVMLPISFPISKVLDWILGKELGTIYTRAELKNLLDLHTAARHGDLTKEESTILAGALDLAQKKVKDIMTNIGEVYALNIERKLDYSTLNEILENGFSRVPVYEGDVGSIVGLLLVKDLALLNPEDKTPIKTVLSFYGREFLRVFRDETLDKMLTLFKRARTHFAVVRKVNNEGEGDPFYQTVGIVTLEDVIEEILQDEIVDETDVYIDNRTKVPVSQRGGKKLDYGKFSVFASPSGAAQTLDPKQIEAVLTYLSKNVSAFSSAKMSETVLRKLIAQAMVVKCDKGEKLYERGKKNHYFSLVLQGKVEVRAGADEFISHAGPFTSLGADAILKKNYFPDFTATVAKEGQILKISKRLYDAALKATQLAKMSKTSRTKILESGNEKMEKKESIVSLMDDDDNIASSSSEESSTLDFEQIRVQKNEGGAIVEESSKEEYEKGKGIKTSSTSSASSSSDEK